MLDEIARRVTTSVRALEGALIRVVAYASMRDEPRHAGLARHVLRRLGERHHLRHVRPRRDPGRGRAGVRGRRGTRSWPATAGPDVAAARQVAMYLARELTDHSLPEIGRGIGGRNHTTVLHAVNRVEAALRTDDDVRTAVDNLRRRLGRPRPDRHGWKNQQAPPIGRSARPSRIAPDVNF